MQEICVSLDGKVHYAGSHNVIQRPQISSQCFSTVARQVYCTIRRNLGILPSRPTHTGNKKMARLSLLVLSSN